ncbi:biopolymer transporter ExbD [Sulfitobacter sp. HNIBRBA3233]|uniref:ExbD/TolR family protein n=1 Tax=Sulfitobacter marinivivus TaxID=3158558 RepID=UPI0032E01F85
MILARPARPARRVTLVPLIDVLFILLVYFMVTSVYRDLDMIPLAETQDAPQAVTPAKDRRTGPVALLRLTAGGEVALRGRTLDPRGLREFLETTAAEGGRLLILPSGSAPLQALTRLMDATAAAGIIDARLVRIEASP